MLGRRVRGRIVSWIVVLTTIGVVYVIVADNVHTRDRKIQPNQIISPWDTSSAPPPYISSNDVKIKPIAKWAKPKPPVSHTAQSGG